MTLPSPLVASCAEDGDPPRALHHLIRGSGWLLATVAAGALGSFASWLVAARGAPSADLGRAAALSSSVLFVVYVTNLGLPVAVSRFAPDRSHDARSLYAWSLICGAGASVIGAVALLLLAPDSLRVALYARGTLIGVVGFILAVVGMALTTLVDVRLMTLRRWGWVFGRAGVVSALRVALLLLVPALRTDPLRLFAVLVGVPAMSGVIGVVLVSRLGGTTRRLLPLAPTAGAAARYASVNYAGILALHAPFLTLPLLVLIHVPSAENANFYIAWSITAVVFLVPQTVAQVLLVEGGKGGVDFTPQRAAAFTIAGLLACVCTVSAILLSKVLPALYGSSYEQAADLLVTLAAGSIAWAFTVVCLTDAQVRSDSRSTIIITLAFASAVLGPALVVVGDGGARSVANVWVAGNGAAAAVALSTFAWERRRSGLSAVRAGAPAAEPATRLA